MQQEEYVLACMDTYKKVLSSKSKDADFVYKRAPATLGDAFIQFGNRFFTRTLSVDIDYLSEISVIFNTISALKIPTPTFIVKTRKGFHLHWLLPYRVKQGGKAAYLRDLINDYLISCFNGDVRAKGFRRMWRNPLTHTTIFTPKISDLSEFKHILPELHNSKPVVFKPRSNSKSRVYVDLSKVEEGDRHNALFKVVSSYSYKIYKDEKGCKDTLTKYIQQYADYCNSLLEVPQPDYEIRAMVNSIVRWLYANYTGSSDRVTSFNRKVASYKADKVKAKILNTYFSLLLKMVTLQAIKQISVRRGGKICGVSKDTYHKYRLELYELLLEHLLVLQTIDTNFIQDIVIEFNKLTFDDINNSIISEGVP